MLERFLARLEQSPHSKYFVLKGAILLSKYIDIGRETRDLDFLARNISNNTNNLKIHFEEIAEINLQDAFEFKNVVTTELLHPHMGYPGSAVTMMCYFGKTRSKVAIDIGFGDIVQPKMQPIILMHSAKGPLFESRVCLSCYPKDFIFAEKLETIVYRGATNSRMKDFHDLYSLILHASVTPFEKLVTTIDAVFKHRQTSRDLPLMYSIKDINQLQVFWSGYLRKLSIDHAAQLPQEIASVIKIINDWLAIHLKS